MKSYDVSFDVGLRVSATIKAESLEAAIQRGREMARVDPAEIKLVTVPRGVQHHWSEDTKLVGVQDA